jgi:hypothetical protein
MRPAPRTVTEVASIRRYGHSPLTLVLSKGSAIRRASRKPGKYGPLRSFGMPLDRAGPRLPVPVTVAVAPDRTLRALLAVGRPGQAAHLPLPNRSAAKPSISRSRSRSASALFSIGGTPSWPATMGSRTGPSSRRSSEVSRVRGGLSQPDPARQPPMPPSATPSPGTRPGMGSLRIPGFRPARRGSGARRCRRRRARRRCGSGAGAIPSSRSPRRRSRTAPACRPRRRRRARAAGSTRRSARP